MKLVYALLLGTILFGCSSQAHHNQPVTTPHIEHHGQLTVEAEAFAEQSLNGVRKWYAVTPDHTPDVGPDPDDNHAATASGQTYLEILPDTRTTHDDPLVHGTSFSNTPGKLAILTYHVWINTPGRYYVWVSAHSTGTEDNGVHVGLNGDWPESGQRMQWCDGKHTWRWESKQRTAEVHCGERYKIFLDIEKPGEHMIQFSMREDGFEMDQWMITTDRDFTPEGYEP